MYKLDVALLDKMIYIEYDGSGHNLQVMRGYITEDQFFKKEIIRKKYLESKGWKIIRIISRKDYLPNDKYLIFILNYCIKYLLNSDDNWIEIDFDNNMMKFKNGCKKLSSL